MKQKFSLHGEQTVDNIEISDFNKHGDNVIFKGVTIKDQPATLVMMARSDGFCLRIVMESKGDTYQTDIFCIDGDLSFSFTYDDNDFNKDKKAFKIPVFRQGE